MEVAGSSILTDAPAPVAGGGNPPAPVDGAQQAIQDAVDGPPEWAPQKFWDPATKQVRTPELGKAYQNLEKLLGGEKVPKPISDDDEEGWSRWYAASGRPDTPDAYDLKRPELPASLPYDDVLEKEFRQWAHINGLNKKQTANLYDGFVKRQIEATSQWQTQTQQARAQAEIALQREHGPGYQNKLKLAQEALKEFADPDYLQYLAESGKGNDPREIRAWIKIGEKMRGETRLVGKPAEQANPQDLDRAIAGFREQYKEALFKKDHPDHDLRVREYNGLFAKRYPNE